MRARAAVVGAGAAVTTILSLLVGPAFAVDGNGQNQPIIGDLNGDGRPDRTILTGTAPDGTCQASFEKGKPDGTFAAPVVHIIVVPGRTFGPCPDMGVVVNLTKHPRNELVAASFIGQAPGVNADLLIIRNWQVVDTASAEFQPSLIGTQDFNGDGYGDIWESSDQHQAFRTFVSSQGHLVTGPAFFYDVRSSPQVEFARFDRNRAQDLVTGYLSSRDQPGLPGSNGAGAMVIFGDTGQRVLLEHTFDFVSLTATPVDVDHDGDLDVQVSGGGLPDRIYLNNGNGHFAPAP
ncbi:MAG TPA: hypothetical protein VLJ59_07575 [Mycobacteriales bacterium]|nr:hypothetical protein [Mycobacteriales bacterium]